MNVRDLAPGTRVALMLIGSTKPLPDYVEFAGLCDGGVLITHRGETFPLSWEHDELYIAHFESWAAYSLPVEDPDLRGNPPELE